MTKLDEYIKKADILIKDPVSEASKDSWIWLKGILMEIKADECSKPKFEYYFLKSDKTKISLADAWCMLNKKTLSEYDLCRDPPTSIKKSHPVETCDCPTCRYVMTNIESTTDAQQFCGIDKEPYENLQSVAYGDDPCVVSQKREPEYSKYYDDDENHNNVVAQIIKSMNYDDMSYHDIQYMNYLLGGLRR